MNSKTSTSPRPTWWQRIIRFLVYTVIAVLFLSALLPFVVKGLNYGAKNGAYFTVIVLGVLGVLILFPLYVWMPQIKPTRQGLQRLVFALACLVTVFAAFYAIENWRGKRAWEKCRREIEAKGGRLDWNAYVPAPIPNEQNILKAPNMTRWFVRPEGFHARSSSESINNILKPYDPWQSAEILATVTVLPPASNVVVAIDSLVLRYDGSNFTETISGEDAKPLWNELATRVAEEQRRVEDTSAPRVKGCQGTFTLSARAAQRRSPLALTILAERPLDEKALRRYLSERLPHPVGILSNHLHAAVALDDPIVSAEDYLNWTAQFEQVFGSLREAFKRPHARIDADYRDAFNRPVVDFVGVRVVAQTLGHRAQSYLLLNQPDKAWAELVLLNQLRKVLVAGKENRPMTLVDAMINIAVVGLCQNVIADGFRLQAWQEPQIAAIAAQTKDLRLVPLLADALKSERAGSTHFMLNTSRADFGNALVPTRNPPRNFWEQLWKGGFALFYLPPEGWIQQNAVVVASMQQQYIEAAENSSPVIQPQHWEECQKALEALVSRKSPYNLFARIAIPNLNRALETTARNQAFIDQTEVACALERFRLNHQRYPETLNDLVPSFLETLPVDLIGGGALKYRRLDQNRFRLYSVAWNGKDDGGITESKKGFSEPDWVWPGAN